MAVLTQLTDVLSQQYSLCSEPAAAVLRGRPQQADGSLENIHPGCTDYIHRTHGLCHLGASPISYFISGRWDRGFPTCSP